MENDVGIIKISVSISSELNNALETMCIKTRLSKSRLIETILRENKDINRFIQARRLETGGFFAAKSNVPHRPATKDKNHPPMKEFH